MQNNIGNDLYGGSMRTFLKIVKEEKVDSHPDLFRSEDSLKESFLR